MTFAKPPSQLPSGTVLPFNDSLSDIPVGWVECDGNNGTQNLRDKYLKATPDASTLPGTTGGQHSHTISTAQMGSHDHPASNDATGSHNHAYSDDGDAGASYLGDNYQSNSRSHSDSNGVTTSTNGSHSHTGLSVGSAGSNNSVNNEPAYAETLFIQKL